MTNPISPTVEIRTAIYKMTALKRGLGADWRLVGELTIEHDHDDGEVYTVLTSDYEGIAEAILTLHATIDAQLALLQRALTYRELADRKPWARVAQLVAPGLALARAINGTTPTPAGADHV